MSKESRRRYSDYLNADYGHSFAVYLGIDVPRRDYDGHLIRLKSSRGCGEYKSTLKAAKESYREDMERRKRALAAMEEDA